MPRREHKNLWSASQYKFGPKPELYQIFVFDILYHLEVVSRPYHYAEKGFYGPGSSSSDDI
jgi:hypothetical protein